MSRFTLLLMLGLLLGGCQLFEVRESEPPTKPPLWNNLTTSWDLCMQNLEYCYNDARNVVKYAGIFSVDYGFSFAPQDMNDYGITGSWGRADEQDMLISVHGQCDSLRLSLNQIEGQNDDVGANHATIYRSYLLNVYKRGNPQPEQYSGSLDLRFLKIEGYWYIDKWYDYRGTEHPSWGKLKYDNSQ